MTCDEYQKRIFAAEPSAISLLRGAHVCLRPACKEAAEIAESTALALAAWQESAESLDGVPPAGFAERTAERIASSLATTRPMSPPVRDVTSRPASRTSRHPRRPTAVVAGWTALATITVLASISTLALQRDDGLNTVPVPEVAAAPSDVADPDPAAVARVAEVEAWIADLASGRPAGRVVEVVATPFPEGTRIDFSVPRQWLEDRVAPIAESVREQPWLARLRDYLPTG